MSNIANFLKSPEHGLIRDVNVLKFGLNVTNIKRMVCDDDSNIYILSGTNFPNNTVVFKLSLIDNKFGIVDKYKCDNIEIISCYYGNRMWNMRTHKNKLYIYAYTKLYILNKETKQFEQIIKSNLLEKLDDNHINSFFIDNTGSVNICSRTGGMTLYHFNPDRDNYQTYSSFLVHAFDDDNICLINSNNQLLFTTYRYIETSIDVCDMGLNILFNFGISDEELCIDCHDNILSISFDDMGNNIILTGYEADGTKIKVPGFDMDGGYLYRKLLPTSKDVQNLIGKSFNIHSYILPCNKLVIFSADDYAYELHYIVIDL